MVQDRDKILDDVKYGTGGVAVNHGIFNGHLTV